ncbi:MAG: hypothetical protein JNM19_16655 [Chitinophagaceae bacterium]|nr:hypothetical protein [Chitinophagaceae bacterium]
MNRKKAVIGFFIIAATAAACSSSKKSSMRKEKLYNPVVAHRGAFKKNSFPENSVAALKEAIRLGCAGSEFDVRMTADDSLIINHDPDYYKLPIEKTTYADLQAYKLSNGEKLPTLREYILAGLDNNPSTTLVCEIKPSPAGKERGKLIAERTVNLFKELNAEDRVVYISFDYDVLLKIRELNKSAQTQYLTGDKTPEVLKTDGIIGADYHFSVFKNHPDWIETAKKNKLILNAWTVNDTTTMNWLLDSGFDYITTNEPELLFEVIKARTK